MPRFDVETLDETDRAFVESMAGINRNLETLKIAFPGGRHRAALESAQAVNAQLVAAALKSES